MEPKKIKLKIEEQGGEIGQRCVRTLANAIYGMPKKQEDREVYAAMCLGYLEACADAGFVNAEDEEVLINVITAVGAGLAEVREG